MKSDTYSIPLGEVYKYYCTQQENYDNISSEAKELKGNNMETKNDKIKLTLYHLENKDKYGLIQESIENGLIPNLEESELTAIGIGILCYPKNQLEYVKTKANKEGKIILKLELGTYPNEFYDLTKPTHLDEIRKYYEILVQSEYTYTSDKELIRTIIPRKRPRIKLLEFIDFEGQKFYEEFTEVPSILNMIYTGYKFGILDDQIIDSVQILEINS